MASLYIHIPFCLGKCEYCSFNSYAGMESLFSRYVAALKKEIVKHSFEGAGERLETVFLGGGTPSMLSSDQIGEIINCCRQYHGIAENAEISMEANPKTINFMKLLQLRQAGITRLSIGVQSFIDHELDLLGRLHSAQDSWECVRDAHAAGFSNINLDLMYGIPRQNAEHWRWNVESALSLMVPHLSLYQLTMEEGTPMARRVDNGTLELPDDDEVMLMDEISARLCGESGLFQYEISNYGRQGFYCWHNINYWHNLDYLAAGAGAVGYQDGRRWKNIEDPLHYCEAVEADESPVQESEKLDNEASFRESVVTGLRMVSGVACAPLYERFGLNLRDYYGDILIPMLTNGLVEFTSSHFRLTKKGRRVANQILAELV